MKEKRLNNNKGFTLMEMLIVVAIIAVLVAIGVTAVSPQLEKAREATDISNIRSSYAQVMTDILLEEKDTQIVVDLMQKENGWRNQDLSDALDDLGQSFGYPENGGFCKVRYDQESKKVFFEFTGSDPGVVVTVDYTNPVSTGKYRAETVEKTLKALKEAGANVNGLLGDKNSVMGANLDFFKTGGGRSFSLDGKTESFNKYLDEQTDFDYSQLGKDIPTANLIVYITDTGDIPVFSYKANVQISPYRSKTVTTFYDRNGNAIGELEGSRGWDEYQNFVNDYLYGTGE